jgi:hypothetical protein
VQSFQVLYRGRPMASGVDLMRRCCGLSSDPAIAKRQIPQGFHFSIVDATVLRSGEANVVLSVTRGQTSEVVDKLSAALNEVSFRACYCSILDECWVSNLQSTRVEPVKACAAPAVRFDPNGR